MAAVALQLRSKSRDIRNPRFVQLFSSSSDSNNGEDKNESKSPSSISSYFSDVKASLKQSSPPPRKTPPSTPMESSSFSSQNPPKVASLEEIRKNLAEFRRKSSAPPPVEKSSPSSSSFSQTQTVSFQELYKRNVIEKSEQGNNTVGTNKSGKLSFDAIRESLRQLRTNKNQTSNDRFRPQVDRERSNVLDGYSLQAFKESLKLTSEDRALNPSLTFGGSETLPQSVFAKELGSKKEGESQDMKTEFVKMYSYTELGEKLRKLRPKVGKGGKNRFSVGELNERLKKLREIEEKELDSRIGGVSFKDLRESLVKLKITTDDKTKKSSLQRLDILGHLRGTPSFMHGTPKDHLVEKYFHPDNMSSEEKLKLELKKVRDEFKMSESDCGSSRVQVAQLTTKIKHLSSVLHKKDKHSRKGLIAMVQRRKKLLKYLRRTDWDSYCFVLDKLGLRDNPDYKL